MQVSVIVTVYNLEKYVASCIKSILNQAFNEFEIIIVDDGSKDNSLSICKEFEALDSRVKVISIENSGVSNARNVGIKNANSKYLIFVDGDDRLDPNFLVALVKDIQVLQNIVISACDTKYTDEFEGEIHSEYKDISIDIGNTEEMLSKIINWEGDCSVCNKLLVKQKIGNLEFVGKVTEDKDFLIRYLLKNKGEFAHRKQSLYLYFNRENSVSRTVGFSESFFEIVEFAQRSIEYTKKETEYLSKCAKYNLFRSKLLILSLIANAKEIGRYNETFKSYKKYVLENKKIVKDFNLPKDQQRVLQCLSMGTVVLRFYVQVKKIKNKLRCFLRRK